jgi:hypothetical protein
VLVFGVGLVVPLWSLGVGEVEAQSAVGVAEPV